MRTVKIGMIQSLVEFSMPERNIERAERMVREAASQGAQICVLPECMDLGWGNPDAVQLAEPIHGKVSEAYVRIARQNGVYLAAGLTERAGERVYNTALLISDEGDILMKHRKINVLTGVEDVYAIGDRIGIVDTKYGKIGMDICADNLEPCLSVGVTLGRMGADIMLSPCAWAVTPERDPVKEPYGAEWHAPYSKLSAAFSMPIVGVSNVGEVEKGSWRGWKAIGNSMAYDSDGTNITVLPYGERSECVRVVEAHIREDKLQGTALAESLERYGL